MKKLILAASITLLAACSAPQPEQVNFSPKATLASHDLVNNATVNFTSKDIRTAQYVALVDSGRSHIEPVHAKQNIRITVENALAEQLQSQGFQITVNSDNAIVVEVQEVLVNVKHSVMQNEMDARVTLQITAETPQGKLVKTFNGTAKRTGSLSASIEEIETVLNDVTNLVMAEIANDQELNQYLKERF